MIAAMALLPQRLMLLMIRHADSDAGADTLLLPCFFSADADAVAADFHFRHCFHAATLADAIATLFTDIDAADFQLMLAAAISPPLAAMLRYFRWLSPPPFATMIFSLAFSIRRHAAAD
jgi:hypothetical protein